MSRAPRCLTTTMSHGASRTTSSIVGLKTAPPHPGPPTAALPTGPGRTGCARGGAIAAGAGQRLLAAPAEDDQVGLLLGGGLDDPLGRVSADPDERMDGRCRPGRSRGPAGAAAGPDGRASRPRTAASPRAPRRCPSASSSPARGSSSAAPIRISSSAVPGLATGIRIRAGSGARSSPGPVGRQLGPALDEVRLEQLELARLPLHALLGLVGRHLAVLDHEAADPPEVDRDERGDAPFDGIRATARRSRSRS